jgi:O-methyltransferase
VTWRRSFNERLTQATGYKIVRADSRVAPRARPAPGAAAKHRKRGLPKHYDEEARQIIRAVKPRTMTAPEKLFGLILATRYIVDRQIPGAIIECGVWRGGSMQAVARTLLARGVSDRDLHLYDTFEGMPEPSERDRRHGGKAAVELLENDRSGKVRASASLEDVQVGMTETGYPRERLHFHPGMVEDTIPEHSPERIALLRLDTDWYASTRHELEHLYDRLEPGGVLILDDYGYWEGARQAVDEFLERTGERLLLLPIASGRIAVKP